MNTAQIIHLLFQVELLVKAGHLHRTILWVGCFSSRPQLQPMVHIAGCSVVRLAPHLAQIRW